MYQKLRFLLAICCFVETVRYGSTQTTSGSTVAMTTAAPTTGWNIEPWNITCNESETFCVYNLRAPGNDPSELSNISAIITADNNTYYINLDRYDATKQRADNFTCILRRLINQLEGLKANLTNMLNNTQMKLSNAITDLKHIQERTIYDTQRILCEVNSANPCYNNKNCPMYCPGNTTIAPTTVAPTTIAPTTAAVSTAVSQTGSVALGSTGSTVSISMGTSTSAATNTPFTGSSTPTTSVSGTIVSGGTTAQRTSAATVHATSAASVQPTSAGTGTTPSTVSTSTTSSGPTTTILTPRPTPPNPCVNKTCDGISGSPGTCVSSNGIARCDCPGDLDPDGCGKVACVSRANGGSDITRIGPFWSPGFTGSGTYGRNTDGCMWKMIAPPALTLNVTAVHFATDDCAILTVNTNTGNSRQFFGNLTDYLGMLNQRLQSALSGADIATFEFISCTDGTSPDYYFDFKFEFIPPPTSASEE